MSEFLADGSAPGSAFPPIAQYAFLSDCETCALVAPSGNVEWLCLPRFDSPSVFGSLLDRDAGGFRLGPTDVAVPADRRYLPGTMVLETSWGTRGGWIIVRDVLLMGPWHHDHGPLPHPPPLAHGLRRRPRAAAPRALRERRGAGAPGLRAGVRLRPPDGRSGSTTVPATARRWPAPTGTRRAAAAHHGHADGLRGPARHRPHADEGGGDAVRRPLLVRAPGARRTTARPTRSSCGRPTTGSTGWTTASSPTTRGAPTSSAARSRSRASPTRPRARWWRRPPPPCPRRPAGERNWDYRYTWIRDATFMLWGLYTLGFDWEANDFFYFIADVAEAEEGQLQIMYGIGGESRARREHAGRHDRLRGRAARADRQRRLRPGPARRVGRLPRLDLPAREDARRASRSGSGRSSASRWRRRWPTGASPTAASGRCAGTPSTSRPPSSCAGWPPIAARGWPSCARTSRRRRGGSRRPTRSRRTSAPRRWTTAGCSASTTTRDALDASVLLMPLVRFLPPEDERVRATVRAIADELTEDGLVLRYRVDATDDGLEGEEGTFTICSFWLVSALVEIGELEAGAGAVREAALLRQPARALRRGDRPALRPPLRELPPGVHPPGADQRRDARDPGRSGPRRAGRSTSAASWPACAPTASGRGEARIPVSRPGVPARWGWEESSATVTPQLLKDEPPARPMQCRD